jgi:hypothetical protein
MRKLMAAALMALPLGLGLGCTTTGGICDCAPVPGDSVGYNPHVTYHATCPGGGCPAAPVAPVAPATSSISNDSFEPAGAPRQMPRN